MNKFFTTLAILVVGAFGASQSYAQTQPMDTTTKRTNLGDARFYVNTPSSIKGLKKVSIATWGGTGNPPLINAPVAKGLDSLAANPLTNPSAVNGKVCLLYRGGGITFAQKVQYAVAAGAIGVIIVNNVPGDPAGMGNTGTTTYTIPIVMLSDVDGNALNSVLLSSGSVNVSIGNWNLGATHDLAFLRAYQSAPHAMSIPYTQLALGANRLPYKNFVGGAVVNYGTATESGVTVVDTISWHPNSGASSTVHTGSYAVPTISPSDSIKFGFGTASSSWSLPSPGGAGYFNYQYRINSLSTDDIPDDNLLSVKQYVTDSIFCKGTYDYTKNQPVATISFRPGSSSVSTYSWGPLFYLADGKYYARKMQYYVTTNGTSLNGEESYGLLFKWTDGSNTQPLDSFVEGDELRLVAIGRKAYTAADSLGFTTTVNLLTPNTNKPVALDSNAWYWSTVQVTQAANQLFIGCDENVSYFTRQFIQSQQNSYNDMAELIYTNDYSTLSGSSTALVSLPFGGHGYDIDSTFFSNLYYIPNVALHLSKNKVGVGVENTKESVIGTMKIFPIPASNSINVDLKLNSSSETVAYRLLNLSGSVVYREDRKNVLRDVFAIPTESLASGIYYLAAFTADGRNAVEKVVVKH